MNEWMNEYFLRFASPEDSSSIVLLNIYTHSFAGGVQILGPPFLDHFRCNLSPIGVVYMIINSKRFSIPKTTRDTVFIIALHCRV